MAVVKIFKFSRDLLKLLYKKFKTISPQKKMLISNTIITTTTDKIFGTTALYRKNSTTVFK